MIDINSIWVFIAAFLVSALAGLAAFLRSPAKVTFRPLLTYFLNSGLLGLGISLLWFMKFRDNLFFLIGICVISGLGGVTFVEYILLLFKQGGFSISINKDGGTGVSDKSEKTNENK